MIITVIIVPAQYDDDGKRPSWIQNLKAGDRYAVSVTFLNKRETLICNRVLVRGVNLKKYGKKEYEDCDLWVLEITGFALDATPDHKVSFSPCRLVYHILPFTL